MRNIYLIIIISLLHFSNNNKKFIEYKFSNITLKINGNGTKNIFTSTREYFSSYPNMIYINGIKQPTITYSYNLNETDNFIELIWNKTINNCYWMFFKCEDITEINLSKFDTSKVTNMYAMFYGCSSLYSLDLFNFNTSNVEDMGSMFNGCSSLSSLNLSNFDTSKVTYMGSMFKYCSSLSSLNLSNFDTSKVTYMGSMFAGCNKLIYFNLKNFIENESLSVYGILDCISDYIVICLNENTTKIKSQIVWKSNVILNCSYDYNENRINTDIINTYRIKTNNSIIHSIDNCSNISLNEQLWIKCNKDYYEIENDNCSSSGYIKCYKDPIWYYLDENIYKKCFYTCKECEINGNNITHNCSKCNDNYPYEIKKIIILIVI